MLTYYNIITGNSQAPHCACGAGCTETGHPQGHGPATITAVNGNQVTVQYQDGTTQNVTVSSSTQIVKEVSGSVADLKPGENVDLPGVASGNGSRQCPAMETCGSRPIRRGLSGCREGGS